MAKTHVVKLEIKNTTGYKMSDPKSWFDSGRLADGWEFPDPILPGQTKTVEMYEKDWVLAGCSGYVEYSINKGTIAIAYSNPSSGSNKLGIGVKGKDVWKYMSNHDYGPFTVDFEINKLKFKAKLECSGGSVNKASVKIELDD